MRTLGVCAVIALVLVLACPVSQAGSADDNWGIDTLVNLPDGITRGTVPNQAGDQGDTTPKEVPCQCSDANPRNEQSEEVGVDCYYHRIFGNCNEQFMFDANAELCPEHFCQISCSRCSCCVSPQELIASLGGNKFLEAAKQTQPDLTKLLSHPGFTGTILMPTDKAFEAAQQKYGDVFTNPAVLNEVLKFHILPPEATRQGLWNSPFMSLGPEMETLYDGPARIKSEQFDLPSDVTWKGGLTGFTLSGPVNEAKVLRSDITGCKSFVTEIDAVLLPFDPSSLSGSAALASGEAVGADQCAVTPNSIIIGDDISSTNVKTIGECCESCVSVANCNAWVYCALEDGCPMPDGDTRTPFGSCTFKRSKNVASNSQPNYEQFDASTTFVVSGWIPSSSQKQATGNNTGSAASRNASAQTVAAAGR